MLKQAVERCPDSLWHQSEYRNQFWHIAYHTIFYAHFYLHPSEDAFVPWEKHRDECVSLGEAEGACKFSKEEILEYLALCLEQVGEHVDALDLTAESGFYWLPFDKLQLQIYNIRHIQHHTGELCERLGNSGDIEIDWVGIEPE